MKRFNYPIAVIALMFAATACHRDGAAGPSSSSPSPPTTPAPAASPAIATATNAFAVEITLSPAARKRLVSQHESLVASAEYFGYPSSQAEAQHVPGSENPWLSLHRAEVELEGAQLDGTPNARFPAVTLDPERLAWTDAPAAPQVNINVYSGRRSSPDNLLECGMFQDTLAIAARAPIKVSCGLIGEARH